MRLDLNKQTGPLYWSTYEYQRENNSFMPEERFKDNVDWMAEEFVPYGFEMVCTDGWIEDSFCLNENGYLLRHHDSWKHNWLYWAEYCNKKGLALGVYYNPLWISPAAVNNREIKVKGTDIPVHDITDHEYVYEGNSYGIDGDRFSYANAEKALYWVDIAKPGAKEYVQGYVKFFIDNKVDFLRVDFLSWYEDGHDKGKLIGRNHGVEHYRTALKWIKEAAEDKIMISLVMPHLKNEGKNEYGMGSLARINEDCGTGKWTNFSDMNRGIQFPWWSQWSNPFDGLIYWSNRFYKHGMIMDADMLRLNTFDTEDECKSAVSLVVLSGAPLDIADQYDTIGKRGIYLKNNEILELNQRGMVAFPLSDDPLNDASCIWVGKISEEDYILGLFNRDSEKKIVNIKFRDVLGISEGRVRDLWKHAELGIMREVTVEIGSHACKVFRIKIK